MKELANTQLEEIQTNVSPRINDLIKLAQECNVICLESVEVAAGIKDRIKKAGKLLEEKRTAITKPTNDFLKTINNFFKGFSEPLDNAEKVINQKLIKFQQDQARIEAEKKRKEQAELVEKARLEAEKLREEGKDRQANLVTKAAETIAKEEVKEEIKSISIGGKSAFTIRKKPEFEVVDLQVLASARPDLITANEILIGQLIRGGVREIPGIRIWIKEIAG